MCKYFTIQNILVVLPCPGELQRSSINLVFDIFLSPPRHLKLCQSGDLSSLYLISQLWVCVIHSAIQLEWW